MGMAKRSGSCKHTTVPTNTQQSPTGECFAVPPSTVQEVVTKTVTVADNPSQIGQLLDNQDYVANTVAATKTTNETSDLAKVIAAYSSYGQNITVTFFHTLNSDTQQRTWNTDFSQTLDNVHYSYLRIDNFQMKLSESLQFNYETGETRSQLTGTALLYPYFCPNQGDLFVYTVDDSTGQMGLFRIYEAPERLSIKASTVHQIKFILMSYLTKEQLLKLNECVDDVRVFDLTRYLNDDGALLTSGEANLMGQANNAINTLLNAYNSEFFDTQLFNTYIDSECLYDPYIVEFITKVIPLSKMPGYPTQLKSNPINWKRSFWFKLLDPAAVPDSILISKCYKVLQEVNYRTAGINALANRCYIAVMKDGKHPYPPFRIPTSYNKESQTLPMQVRLYLDEGKVRPEILLDLASKILGSSRRAQFYYIPIIIFLLQKLVGSIQTGNSITYNEDKQPEEQDCMDGCMNCIYACNPLTVERKLCPGTLVCDCHNAHEYIPEDGGSIDDCPCSCCDGDTTESKLNLC